MEDKKLSKIHSTAKNMMHTTEKAFHQINKELGLKGRIAVAFGIAIVWLLGALVAHTDDRYEQSFDRDGRGSMMQGKYGMMPNPQQSRKQNETRGCTNMKGAQGCSQQATLPGAPTTPPVQAMESHADCPFAAQEAAVQNEQAALPGAPTNPSALPLQ